MVSSEMVVAEACQHNKIETVAQEAVTDVAAVLWPVLRFLHSDLIVEPVVVAAA